MGKAKSLLLATTVAVAVALAGGSAFAADLYVPPAAPAVTPAPSNGLYISVFGGYAFSNNVYGQSTSGPTDITVPLNSGYVIGGAVGANITNNLRGEVEISYVHHGVDASGIATSNGPGTFNGNASTLYLLGNLWYDIDTGSGFTPYVGGGLGAAVVMPNVDILGGGTMSTSATAFAAQLGAGVKVQVADNMALDLGYRAKGVFNATLKGTGAADLANTHYVDQTIQVGLDIGF